MVTRTPTLVVWPPVISPVRPPFRPRQQTGEKAAGVGSIDFYDANLSFYESLPAGPPEEGGGFSGGKDPAAGLLRLVRAEDPPSLERAARVMSDAHRRFSAMQAAFFPTRIGWGWILCPTLKSAAAATAFVRDRSVNPFVSLTESEFAARLSEKGYEAVVFAVQETVQCPAALTLSDYCRRNAPGTERILKAPPDILRQMAPFFDRTAETSPPSEPAAFFARPEAIALRQGESGPARGDAKVLFWRIDPERASTFSNRLSEAAGQGAWNHIDILGALPDAPPDRQGRIHSWCSYEQAPYLPAGAARTWPDRTDRYRRVCPLPGTPFWDVVRDPAMLARWLGEMSAAELSRWRIDAVTGDAFRLGDDLQYRFAPPGALSEKEMDEICQMVVEGGSVGSRWVRRNLAQAYLIGVVTEAGVIVANSSLKHPRKEYVEKVSQAAGIDLTGFLERGYTSVRPEYRGLGIGTRLLEGLTRRARGYRIFSIIGEDNAATQKIAVRNRTRKVVVFYSRALRKPVGLWMPEAIADEFSTDRKVP